MSFEPWHCRLRYTFDTSPLWIESGNNIQNALPAESREIWYFNRRDYPFAHVVANPARHVVIAPLPLNAAMFIANRSQPLDEVINVRSARERHNSFDVSYTVESVEGSGEHLGLVGRSDQRIWFVGASKEAAGDCFDTAGN